MVCSIAYAGVATTRTGAYDPGAVAPSVIRGTLTTTPVAICGTGNLAHVGTFRVKARVYASNVTATNTFVRLSWKEGDGPLRANGFANPPIGTNWAEVDLGLINIPEKTLGTQRWTGQIEAYTAGTPGADTIDIDYLLLIPVAEGYGKARAPLALPTTPTVFSARDEFDQVAGNLGTKTLPVGGTWTTSGAPTDYVVETTGHTLQRSTTGDSSDGRTALAGTTTFTNGVSQVDISYTTTACAPGLFARYIDTGNFVKLWLAPATNQVFVNFAVAAVLLPGSVASVPLTTGTVYTLRFAAYASGYWAVYVFPRGAQPISPVLSGWNAALATGGGIASGKTGIYDLNASATACTRTYDNFAAWVPVVDAAVYSGRAAEIRHDSTIRQESTGTYYGPVSSYRGAHFYLPPAGAANRTSRILVKTRRNDIDLEPDDQIADSTTVTVHFVPRFSTVPR